MSEIITNTARCACHAVTAIAVDGELHHGAVTVELVDLEPPSGEPGDFGGDAEVLRVALPEGTPHDNATARWLDQLLIVCWDDPVAPGVYEAIRR